MLLDGRERVDCRAQSIPQIRRVHSRNRMGLADLIERGLASRETILAEHGDRETADLTAIVRVGKLSEPRARALRRHAWLDARMLVAEVVEQSADRHRPHVELVHHRARVAMM